MKLASHRKLLSLALLASVGVSACEEEKKKTPKTPDGSVTSGTGGSIGMGGRGVAGPDAGGLGGAGGRGGAGGMGGSGGAMIGMGGSRDAGAGGTPGTGGTPVVPRDMGADTAPILMADAAPVVEPSPAPFAGTSIGAPGMMNQLLMNSPMGESQSLKITSSGADIGGVADSFYFTWLKATGNIDIIARVSAMANPDMMAKAGVMIRANAMPGSQNAFLAILGDTAAGGRFQFRKTAGGMTDATIVDAGTRVGQFLRLRREGNKITAARSSNKLNWFTIGDVTLDGLPAEALIGIAVESHKADAPLEVEVNSLRVNNLFASAVTSTWAQEEVGTVGTIAVATGSKIALTSWGQPWTLGDKDPAMNMAGRDFLHYLFKLAEARDTTAVVKVESIQNTDPMARTGLMVRENTAVNMISRSAPFAMISVTAGKGVEFHSRGLSAGANMVPGIAAGMVAANVTAPVWLKMERVGNEFTGSYSKDGSVWTKLDSVKMLLFSDNPAFGVGSSSWNPAALATSTIDNLWVGTGTPPLAPDGGAVVSTPDAGVSADAPVVVVADGPVATDDAQAAVDAVAGN